MKQFDEETEFIFMLPSDSREFDVRELVEFCGLLARSDPYYCRARRTTWSSEDVPFNLSADLIRAPRTSWYAMLSAIYMGCSEINLVGFGHGYPHSCQQEPEHFFKEQYYSEPGTDTTPEPSTALEVEFLNGLLLILRNRGGGIRNLSPRRSRNVTNKAAVEGVYSVECLKTIVGSDLERGALAGSDLERGALAAIERCQRDGVERVYLYGAGSHTEIVVPLWSNLGGPPICGVVVSDAPTSQNFSGIPLVQASALAPRAGDGIVLSSRTFEVEMAATCERLWPNTSYYPLYRGSKVSLVTDQGQGDWTKSLDTVGGNAV